jgi:hypothetical protein
MLVDHLLRAGYYETAGRLAADAQIEVISWLRISVCPNEKFRPNYPILECKENDISKTV